MSPEVRIDFIADISCPWCVIGLKNLEQAIVQLEGRVDAQIHCQPFELNPGMVPEGENLDAHLAAKTGMTASQAAEGRRAIAERAEAVGFAIRMSPETRIYNSFDAHRLLWWARDSGRQVALHHALYQAYFTEGQNISDHRVLIGMAERVGLNDGEAARILTGEGHAQDVRSAEELWQSRGIKSVPAIILNSRHLVSGGQPPEVFAAAILQVAGLD